MSAGITVEDFKHVPGVNDAEYIELLKKALERQKYLTSKAIAKLKAQPEIIRCIDCKFRNDAARCEMLRMVLFDQTASIVVGDGDYCCWAIRRTDGYKTDT